MAPTSSVSNSLKFNGIAASSFTIDSATRIRAQVPSGATTGKISVTTVTRHGQQQRSTSR